MIAALAALALAVSDPAPGDVPPAVSPVAAAPSVGDLQLQLATLQTRRDAIHWTAPAIVTLVGINAGWTGVEATAVTVVGTAVGCKPCSSDEAVSAGVAIGGAVVLLVGLVWLAIDFHQRTQLGDEIDEVQRKLLDLRGLAPGPPVRALTL